MSQQSTLPYYQACVYSSKRASGKAYAQIERIIHDAACELSAYRFLLPADHLWYVVIIGRQPDQGLHKRLETILTLLTRGKPVSLDQTMLTHLLAQRTKQLKKGSSWQEQHGIRLFSFDEAKEKGE